MTKQETIAWLKDLLFEDARQFLPTIVKAKHIDAIEAAIEAISQPVRVEIWTDGEQRVRAHPLIEVKIRNFKTVDQPTTTDTNAIRAHWTYQQMHKEKVQ